MTIPQFAALMILSATVARSDMITFTYTGTGSGQIGSTSFTDASFTITGVGDTTNRMASSLNPYGLFIDDTTASIVIAGIGSFDFLTGTRAFVNDNPIFPSLGFSRAGDYGADLFDLSLAAPFTWDMLSSIGPITGDGRLLQWAAGSPLPAPVITSGGTLVFDSGATPATFVATVTAVSEPSSISSFAICLIGILEFVRRNRNYKRAG